MDRRSAGTTSRADRRGASTRARTLARVVTALLALFWGLFWFGLFDLLVVVEQDELFHEHYLLESGWGLLYLVLVTVPLVELVARPGRSQALAQVGVCALAVLVGGLWGMRWPQLVTGVGLVATVALIAWLERGHVPARRPADRVLVALAVVALAAAVVYGSRVIAVPVSLDDITNGVGHHAMQASLGIAIAGCVGLGAVTAGRLPLWCAAFSATWLGVESLVYPDLDGSFGTVGGWGALIWSAVLLAWAAQAPSRTARSTMSAGG